jgi:murein L,D-transpeptidase YafK
MNPQPTILAAFAALAAALFTAPAAAPAAAQRGGPLGSPIPGQPLGQAVERPGIDAFLAHQLTFDRVAGAREAADERLRAVFAEAGLAYPAREIFLRVLKHERVLELWARSHPDAGFTLVRSYPVCALPGQLGPKRRMGDVQVPEGFYFIDGFNPRSAFHLSLRVDYPNTADRMRREALTLGGDIFIHGGCATVGCVPIEDRNIEEVYWLAVQVTDAGQRLIPVHIFPARLDDDNLRWLQATFSPEPELLDFWRNLAEGYAFFEETRRVPWVTVAESGAYVVPERPALARDAASEDAASEDAASDDAADAPGHAGDDAREHVLPPDSVARRGGGA